MAISDAGQERALAATNSSPSIRVGERRRGRPPKHEARLSVGAVPWIDDQPLLLDDRAAMRALSMGRTKFHEAVRDRRLIPRYVGRMKRYHRDDIALFAASLPTQPDL